MTGDGNLDAALVVGAMMYAPGLLEGGVPKSVVEEWTLGHMVVSYLMVSVFGWLLGYDMGRSANENQNAHSSATIKQHKEQNKELEDLLAKHGFFARRSVDTFELMLVRKFPDGRSIIYKEGETE